MKSTIAVWGIPKGETGRWQEDLLSGSCRSQSDVDKVKAAAGLDGYHSFRQATLAQCHDSLMDLSGKTPS